MGRGTLLATALAAVLLAAAPVSALACDSTSATPRSVTLDTLNSSVVCLLNGQRILNGLPMLRESAKLDDAATGHSIEMKRRRYFSHDSADGSPFTTRISASGFLRGANAWGVGENIAWGGGYLGSPDQLVTNWMNSPGHRANILNPSFQVIGVGSTWGSPAGPSPFPAVTITTDFGYRKG